MQIAPEGRLCNPGLASRIGIQAKLALGFPSGIIFNSDLRWGTVAYSGPGPYEANQAGFDKRRSRISQRLRNAIQTSLRPNAPHREHTTDVAPNCYYGDDATKQSKPGLERIDLVLVTRQRSLHPDPSRESLYLQFLEDTERPLTRSDPPSFSNLL